MPVQLIRKYPWHVLAAVAGSLLLSWWAVHVDDVINNDGIEYLYSAADMLQGDWSSAIHQYKWPFYSMTIAGLTKVTGLPLEASAYTLTAILFCVLVTGFLSATMAFGGDRRTVTVALAVALLHPALNEYRSFIIRDVGYLAFYLWAVSFFVRYLCQHDWRSAAAGLLALITATGFRVEGFVFLTLIPLAFLSRGSRATSRRVALAAVLVLSLAAVVTVSGWWMFTPTGTLDYRSFINTPLAVLSLAWEQVGAVLAAKIELIKAKLLTPYSADYAYIVVLFSALIIVLTESIKTMTVVYTGVIVYGLRRCRLFPEPGLYKLWLLLLTINAFVMLVFALTQLFVAPRYPLALVVTALIAVPFILVELYDRWRATRPSGGVQRWGTPAVMALLVVIGILGLNLGTHKRYIKHAGLWLRDHAPAQATIFTNDKILGYYTDHRLAIKPISENIQKLLAQLYQAWWHHDYVALRIRSSIAGATGVIANDVHRQPDVIFTTNGLDQALVYRTQGPQSELNDAGAQRPEAATH